MNIIQIIHILHLGRILQPKAKLYHQKQQQQQNYIPHKRKECPRDFTMKFDAQLMLLIVLLALPVSSLHGANHSPPGAAHRRILHPLFPDSSSPPLDTEPLPPPQPDSSGWYDPDQPFFPEDPYGDVTPTQTPTPVVPVPVAVPVPPTNGGSAAISTAKQPTKATKRAVIAIWVGVGALGMVSALLFYVIRCKARRPVEEEGGNAQSQSCGDGSRAPPSSFLYVGTVDPHSQRSAPTKGSPYHKLISSPTDTGFSSPEDDQGPSPSPAPRQGHGSGRPSSPDVIKHAILPSIKTAQPPHLPKLPPQEARLQPLPPENTKGQISQINSSLPRRVKFRPPPPPPNPVLLQSISTHKSHRATKVSASTSLQAPPPPPLPQQPEPVPPKVRSTWTNFIKRPSESTSDSQFLEASPRQDLDIRGSSSGRVNGDDTDGTKAKLKPLHWDKVRATSDRATVWDQLKPGSFQLNEDMMESLFGCNPIKSNKMVDNESTRKPVLPPAQQQKWVLDPKKSQNIAILLRSLNVTRDEVSEALLDGNSEVLGAELLETLLKMAPTKEEEIKLTGYKGDSSKLGSAEKFLKAVLDIPFSFRRVEAMLYRENFDTELQCLRKSFETLEEASSELMNSRLFLKLLQAVLTTGNRMNIGTNRGGAESFTLDTLLKLVDIKGIDGKTTLLHFVVQEMIKSEGIGSVTLTGNSKGKEEEFRSQAPLIVAGLNGEIGNVKLAAGMDLDVLHSNVSKIENGLQKLRTILQCERPDVQGKFFKSMKAFLRKAEEGICRIKEDEIRALTLVREATEYFHGETARKEAHPLRIFIIVRDFLSTLDHVCKDMGTMKDKTVTGAAKSFHISSNAPLPVISRFNVRQDYSTSEESSSP